MNRKNLGKILKETREKANVTVQQVSDVLVSKGFKATKNTIYSWENDNSQPTPDALMELCILYRIDNILETFGYGSISSDSDTLTTTDSNEKDLLNTYRKLNPDNQAYIRIRAKDLLKEQSTEEELSATEDKRGFAG